jgi:hypothetical protein
MADDAAGHALLTPPEERDDVIASLVEGFRDGCIKYGIPIEPGDLAYRQGQGNGSRRSGLAI